MQSLVIGSSNRNGQLLDSNKKPLKLRVVRFLRERYAQRERPSVAAEFITLAVIVVTTSWPLMAMVQALKFIR